NFSGPLEPLPSAARSAGLPRVQRPPGPLPELWGGLNGSLQHHLRLMRRGGVYGKTWTGRAELGRTSRYVVPLEGGTPYAGDCASAEVRSRIDSQPTRAARRNRPKHPPSCQALANVGRT